MKRFFLALVMLPLVSFGGLYPDFVEFVSSPTNILFFRGFTYNRTGTFNYSDANGTRDTLTAYVINSVRLGVQVNPSTYSVGHPSGDNEVFKSSPNIDYCVTRYYDRSRWYNLDYLPDLYDSLHICCNLISSGYRSSVVEIIYDYSNNVTCNFRIGDVFRDVLTGTNTMFRSQLLSQLSYVNGFLQTLALSLGTVSADYKTVNDLYLNPSKQNLLDSAANPSSLNANSSIAANLDRLYGSSYAGRESEITKALSELARSQLQAAWLSTLDPDSPFYMQDLNNIISDPSTFQQAALQGGGGGGSAIGNIMRDVKRLSTNDWVAGVTNQLANNRASITNQLAHMFDDDTSVGSKLGNIEASSSQSASAAGSIDERLARGITVAVVNSGANSVLVSLDGPVNIDQTQFNSLSVPLGSLQRSISDWYSDWYSFFSVSSPVYKWENFYNMVSSFKDDNHTDLVSLQSCVSNLLLSLHGDITNSLVSTNGYLLLSDYADYIHSGGLDTLLDVMDDDSYIDLKSEIDSLYHADASEGYGRWWRYFTGLSTVQANSIFKLSNIFQAHEKLLTDLKRDNSDLDVQDASDPSVFRKLLYTIPTEEDTFNKLAQLTNSIDQSGMVRIQLLIPDLTNRLSVAASLFDKDFSLPTEISWELIPADPSINSKARIVTIRPYDHYRLFQMLHYGLAFSYCLVNLILFPKFLLLLVRLFDRVWNKSEKLIYNSTQS